MSVNQIFLSFSFRLETFLYFGGINETLRGDALTTGWKRLGDVIRHDWFRLIKVITLCDVIVVASTFVSM